MKKLLILILLPISVWGQCISVPNCTNIIEMVCNDLSNQNTNTNTCFNGYGTIPTSYNWNNWSWLQFHSTIASINVDQNLNMDGSKKIFNSGYAVNYWGNTNFGGGDTMNVGLGCVVTVAHPYSNNSNPGSKNVIILETGARLLTGNSLTEYYVGDTVKTNPGNNSNNIYVLGCNSTALGNKITDFTIIGNTLSWFVEDSDNIQIQYSDNSRDFTTIHFTNKNSGYLKIYECGYYRIKSNDIYSKTLPFNLKKLEKDNKIYYFMGYFYTEKPNTLYYGTKNKN